MNYVQANDAKIKSSVAHLSELQKQALIRQIDQWGSRAEHKTSWMGIGRVLKAEGLIRFVQNPRSSKTELTPLGLAARSLLLS